MRVIEEISVCAIRGTEGRRIVDESSVRALSQSIQNIGLRTPITVRMVDNFTDTDGVVVDGQPVLVTGAHRLAAVKSLGWDKVECYVSDDESEIDAQLWEIDENLCRHELSATEQAEHKTRREELWKAREQQIISSQVGTELPDEPASVGRPEGFATETAKITGESRTAVYRDLNRGKKVCQEARDLIRNTKLDTGAMLDRLAKMEDAGQINYCQESLDLLRDKEARQARQEEERLRDAESKELREAAVLECLDFLCSSMSGKDWAFFVDCVERAGGSISSKQLRQWQAP